MDKTRTLILGLGAALVLAGCIRRDDRLTLKCMTWADVEQTRIMHRAIAEFNRVHPDVKVEVLRAPFGDYITKVLTQFAGRMAPDVMGVNAEQLPVFSDRKVLLDLGPYTKGDPEFKPEEFYPQILDRYTVDGKLSAIPADIAPICVVYYNRKAFREAGILFPGNNWTRNDFLEKAKKLTKRDEAGQVVRWAFVDDWPIWEAWVYSNGARLVDDVKKPTRCVLDDPRAVEGVQFRADLIHKHRVMPSPSNVTAMGGMGNSDLFINGKAAMFFSGIWKTPRFREIETFEWDAVPFPVGPTGKRGFPMSGTGYAVLASTKHPELAYELARFLSSGVGQRFMAATGLIQPARIPVAKGPEFLDGMSPVNKRFMLDTVKYGVFRPFDPRADEWMNLVGSRLDRVWSGDKTAAEVLPAVAKEVNDRFFKK